MNEREAIDEEWRDVVGYEGLYEVSNHGRVRSKDRLIIGRSGLLANIKGQILHPILHCTGYLVVNLADRTNGRGCKQKKVHRLVAEAFLDNLNNLPYINHKDENPTNNNAENLEWCSAFYNANYGTRNAKISRNTKGKKAKAVIGTHIETGKKIIFPSLTSVSDGGFNKSNIWKAIHGRIHSSLGYTWRYLESKEKIV